MRRHSQHATFGAQALKALLQTCDDAQIGAVLPSWAHVLPKLVLDNDRVVGPDYTHSAVGGGAG